MKGKNIVIEIDNFDVIKDKEIQGCIIRCSMMRVIILSAVECQRTAMRLKTM